MSEFDQTLEVSPRAVVAAQWGPWSEVRTFTTAPEPVEPTPTTDTIKNGKGWGKGGKK